jgi:hypothetical protein
MGWTLSISSKNFEKAGNASASACVKGAQWSFTPNADRTTSGDAGSIPAWQAQRVCQHVLSTLVGFD